MSSKLKEVDSSSIEEQPSPQTSNNQPSPAQTTNAPSNRNVLVKAHLKYMHALGFRSNGGYPMIQHLDDDETIAYLVGHHIALVCMNEWDHTPGGCYLCCCALPETFLLTLNSVCCDTVVQLWEKNAPVLVEIDQDKSYQLLCRVIRSIVHYVVWNSDQKEWDDIGGIQCESIIDLWFQEGVQI